MNRSKRAFLATATMATAIGFAWFMFEGQSRRMKARRWSPSRRNPGRESLRPDSVQPTYKRDNE